MAGDGTKVFDTGDELSAVARLQLRLHHLFALTGVTAILLGISGVTSRRGSLHFRMRWPWWVSMWGGYAPDGVDSVDGIEETPRRKR